MAKFCMYCGNPLDEGVAFCDNCGARVDAPQEAQSEHTPTQPNQQYAQPAQQYARTTQQSAPYAQPYTPQPTRQPYSYNGYPSQPAQKKSKAPLIIALSAAAVVIIAAVVIVLFVYPGILTKSGANGNRGGVPPATKAFVPTTAETQPPTEITTEAPTESPTEAPTEVPTVPTTEPPAPLPYIDSIGKPAAADFKWISDAQSGNLAGSFLGTDDLVGKWKGEIIYEGVWELVYVTIDRDAKITIEPYQINYGDGWEDESGEAPYVFNGAFDISSVNGAGSYGSINLYTFLESHGTQYAVGTFSVNNSSSADVYMVRP